MGTVCAVVVTYNRRHELARCLEAIQTQTRPPDRIAVIDNASSDGTRELLEREWSGVEAFIMDENLGGAGGFHHGMRWAFEQGYDLLWLMDDDGLPAPDCLERQLEASERHGLGISGPLVVDASDESLLTFGLDRETEVASLLERADGDLFRGEVNPFNGTLIHRDVVTRIGLIKREMFIWGDEEEYILRAKHHGLPVGTVVTARYLHPPKQGGFADVLFGRLGKVALKPAERAGIFFRNRGFINDRYGSRLAHLRVMAKYTVYFLVDRRLDLRGLKEFYRYYLDGVTDRYRLAPARPPRDA